MATWIAEIDNLLYFIRNTFNNDIIYISCVCVCHLYCIVNWGVCHLVVLFLNYYF